MKATGIVRRIDDLGRVVIPKEIRRTMRIRVGDPLEIFTNDRDEMIFKKYSTMNSMREFAETIADAVFRVTGEKVVIADRERIIAATGDRKRELLDRELSEKMLAIVQKRVAFTRNGEETQPMINSDESPDADLCIPIIVEGDIAGAVIAYEVKRVGEKADTHPLQIAAELITKQLEQ